MVQDWYTFRTEEWAGFTPWDIFAISPPGEGDVFRLDAIGWFRPGLEAADSFSAGLAGKGTQ